MQYDLEKRKLFVLWAHASTCFENCMSACDEIIKLCPSENSQLYKALSHYAVIEYVKPFKNNRGVGKLPVEVVPKIKLTQHNHAVELRDKIFAHIDCDYIDPKDEVFNPVRIDVTSRSIDYLVSDTRISRTHVDKVRGLSHEMFTKAKYHTAKHISAMTGHGKRIPRGLYKVNLASGNESALTLLDIDPDSETEWNE